jgi:hypothetical protein
VNDPSTQIMGSSSAVDSLMLRFALKKCISDCQDDSTLKSYFENKQLKLLFLNKYYDESDFDNPIKDYIKEFRIRTLYYGDVGETMTKITPHKVEYLNGTSDYFYSAEEIYTMARTEDKNYLHFAKVVLGDRWVTHTQFEEYEIDSVSSRMLDTTITNRKETEDKETNVGVYYALFVMSQIGGLIYFLRAVFGFFYYFFAGHSQQFKKEKADSKNAIKNPSSTQKA